VASAGQTRSDSKHIASGILLFSFSDHSTGRSEPFQKSRQRAL